MFRFIRKPSSGSHNQYLAKIKNLVKSIYVEAVEDSVPSHSARYTRLTGHNMQP